MASQQQQRRNNTTQERDIHVEKDIVPKRATHFEELATKTTTDATGKGATVVAVGVTRTTAGVDDKMRGLDIRERGEGDRDHKVSRDSEQRDAQSKQQSRDTEREGKQATPSVEEVDQPRQTAQHNSAEDARAAEERYAQAKERAANAAYCVKESAKHGLGAAAFKVEQASNAAYEVKESAKESAKQGVGTAANKVWEGVGATTAYLSEKTVPLKEIAIQKAQQVKETILTASEHAGERSLQAEDTTIRTTGAVAEYVGEKAAVVKDVVVETGKTAAGYAGKVAEGVKDQAVVAGWGVAHKTTEIAVEATKMAGGVVGKAKDVVGTAAQKAAELAEAPVVMARDTAVGAGEKLADYTARKKVEAERCREEKHTHYSQEGTDCTADGGIGQQIHDTAASIKDKVTDTIQGSEESMTRDEVMTESDTGVLGAIGETIAEIAQHTTQLVTGTGLGPGMQAQVKEKL